ncbi:alpha/beta hydrolase [Raoultella sp. BAC10a-01-01]|uniref:Alpha/beta hydrolase n=1 Tax=Raoultella scottii TaxID=3040937 RepID=A0ABU8Z041_9ENTR
MNRRYFLKGLVATAFIAKTGKSLASLAGNNHSIINLWNGIPPGGGGPKGKIKVSSQGALSHISIPTLTVLTAMRPNGRSVLIAAGGGYKRIEMEKEAYPAANWLTSRGYTAYILSYRLPDENWADGNLVSLQDAQRALRIIRKFDKYVSVLGFSAGGHLLGLAATRQDFASYSPRDSLDESPAYADRAALIYPIITLEKPYTHTSTHKLLVGVDAPDDENKAWSVENYITPSSPPFFLVQAEDDPISAPENTLIMYSGCQRKRVPVEMYRYTSGGHGFGMGRPGTPTTDWPEHYEHWLHK